ncbi:MAG: deoxyribose-phosphate aldolase [Ruminococcus sp.]|nr:deoxyribose-phosphate aldolase [Ruminococcus sp.]MDY3895249.1 deoxyribose-phosphate aldolase [Candidatus Fimenecus sp.]
MDINEILSHCDHTNLKQTAVPDDIKRLIDEAVEYKTASVCIPPCYVKLASEYAAGKTRICTVVGFPNGYSTTEVKAFETKQALLDGADEIDMVINIGALKSGNTDYVENEIKTLKEVCGDKCLKVIIETCLLTEDEKKTMCDIVSRSKADYIKTSTGFSHAGATHNDIKLFKKYVSPSIKIKAAGGIHTQEDAAEFLSEGADRLGASALVSLAKSALDKN